MERLAGGAAWGYYHSGADDGHEWIGLDSNLDQPTATHTIIHEGVHALTHVALVRDPALQRSVASLMNAVHRLRGKAGSRYSYENVSEFLAEAMSNAKFQDVLRSTPI